MSLIAKRFLMWMLSWVFTTPCVILQSISSEKYNIYNIYCWLGIAISFWGVGRLRGAWWQRPRVKLSANAGWLSWTESMAFPCLLLHYLKGEGAWTRIHIPFRLGRVVPGSPYSSELNCSLVYAVFILKIMMKKRKRSQRQKDEWIFFFKVFL